MASTAKVTEEARKLVVARVKTKAPRTPEEVVHEVDAEATVNTQVFVHPGWDGIQARKRSGKRAEEIAAALLAEYGGALEVIEITATLGTVQVDSGKTRYNVIFDPEKEAVAETQ